MLLHLSNRYFPSASSPHPLPPVVIYILAFALSFLPWFIIGVEGGEKGS
jgi:hypothetical protein